MTTPLYPPATVARTCARLGYHVFPTVPDKKTPALKHWPQLATTDTEQIQAWWGPGSSHQGCGVAIHTGPVSGIWVLDIDNKGAGAANGYQTLRTLFDKHHTAGADNPLRRTMTVLTRSGGAHVYLRWTDSCEGDSDGNLGPVANSVARLGSGLDIRAHHGYVLAPGNPGYHVAPRPDGGPDTRLEAAMSWLTELARKPVYKPTADTPAPTGSEARQRAAVALQQLAQAPEGTRNDTLNTTAFRLGKLHFVSEDEAWRACDRVLDRIGAGDSPEERWATFRSGWTAGTRHPANQQGAS